MNAEEKYLSLLSLQYPTINSAAAEIINLSSMLNLPKGTELFLSDIHGEFTSFQHVLKNGSGAIMKKICDEFGSQITKKERKSLATLIYYPEEKLDMVEHAIDDFDEWCKKKITQLIRVLRRMASKYPTTKIRKATPSEFEYIIEELLAEREEVADKELYFDEIIDSIISTERAKNFISVVCRLIQHLSIDRLHVIGDIYDRGNGAVQVMDRLASYHSLDIQWGNHDVAWIGAACGSLVCIASVIRISVRYNNLSTVEDGYGINLVPLVKLAMSAYGDDECSHFICEGDNSDDEGGINAKIHKAITVIQMKLEGQLSARRKEFDMGHRIFLDKIDYGRGTVNIDGTEYALEDNFFPTVDPSDPYALTKEEESLMQKLQRAFMQSEKLQRHVDVLLSKGSMYHIYNGNLLYHGCIPMTADGEFKEVNIGGKRVKGRALYDELENWVRRGRYSHDEEERNYGLDVFWFIWSNENSPLFGKDKMATFERYFLSHSDRVNERKDPYYSFLNDKRVVKKIFEEFGIDYKTGHIINGHVPVKIGTSPIYCDGKVLIIDGGFSKAYYSTTGIAGYTLVFNSRELKLVALEPFVSKEDAIKNEIDIHSSTTLVDYSMKRERIADTDSGREMAENISDLKKLMLAYKSGRIRER